ncbi:MAG: hypothetical protein C0623_13255 [Desulfuromonas sp.]|nr:MAG: hypothetical protein C0623_13255 [Desulfuromonas sp.]
MATQYRLLLVDDVQLMRGIAKSYFDRSEFQVSTARDGQEALRMAKAIKPHLVIMDAEMPGMDGIECCRKIKNDPELFTTPVIILTDRAGNELDALWESGCDGLLTRPLGRREILAAARQYVALANRAAPRIDRNILVKYGPDDELEWHDYAHNLGTGGIFLATEKTVELDSRFQIEFLLPRAGEPVRCTARVAWLNRAEKMKRPDLPPGIGLEFVDLDRDWRLQLQQFVLDSARMHLSAKDGG